MLPAKQSGQHQISGETLGEAAEIETRAGVEGHGPRLAIDEQWRGRERHVARACLAPRRGENGTTRERTPVPDVEHRPLEER